MTRVMSTTCHHCTVCWNENMCHSCCLLYVINNGEPTANQRAALLLRSPRKPRATITIWLTWIAKERLMASNANGTQITA